jgi:hypothetical protein
MSAPNPECPGCQAFQAQVAQLLRRVEELEARLNQHSANPSRPPSSDPPAAPKRPPKLVPSGRKRGGSRGIPASRGNSFPRIRSRKSAALSPHLRPLPPCLATGFGRERPAPPPSGLGVTTHPAPRHRTPTPRPGLPPLQGPHLGHPPVRSAFPHGRAASPGLLRPAHRALPPGSPSHPRTAPGRFWRAPFPRYPGRSRSGHRRRARRFL